MKNRIFISGQQNSKKSPAALVAQNKPSSFFEPVIQPKLTINQPNDIYEQEADAMAEKVMRMKDPSSGSEPFFKPGITSIQRKCEHCEEEEELQLRRKETNDSSAIANHDLDTYVGGLSGSGQPLPTEARSFFEPRFGYGFGDVKVHTDAVAAKSAQSINALAYTSGNNIVFNRHQFSPDTESGKKLLAHELTHVLQQAGSIHKKIQRACFDEDRPNRNLSACAEGSQDVGRQAQGQPNARDARANAIIATAQSTTLNLQEKAMQVVNDIICSYMPSQASKVRKILYYPADSGLHTQSAEAGAIARGDICVGDYFVTNTSNAGLPRRVLQVAHELEHIDQYRSGMTGASRSAEREFLAFYDEALADEFTDTGRMSNATRRSLIDGAIGYYFCLDSSLQTQYSGRLQNLSTRRQEINSASGNTPTAAPTACRRQ